ncbi:MAG: MurT ligase domain-containing protein [Actinomycetes bacterium]
MGTRLRTRMAVSAGRLAAAASRAANRGEGMIIGGKVVLKLDPNALSDLAGDRVLALVSSTNGKTSTTRMLATAVAATGQVATQSTGANMTAGVIAALATGPANAPAVLEVDEAYLPMMVSQTRPKVILLGNLTRDQLDRMNEVAMVARKWRTMIAEHPQVTVVANADDPIVSFAAEQGASVVWVGAGQSWTADSSVCPNCGALLGRSATDWWCGGCERRRPTPAWQLHWADGTGSATGPDGTDYDLSGLALPGRFNAANATLALAACVELGLDPVESIRRMGTVTAVSGRYSVVQIGTLRVRLLLAKNPASWTELLDVMPAGAPVIITINANAADGRDPSWLWDVPFERLRGRTVIATGNRRRDLAVRLLHADVDHVVIEDPYAPGAPLPPGTRDLDVIDCAATYTAFHWLRTDAAKDTSSGPGADR